MYVYSNTIFLKFKVVSTCKLCLELYILNNQHKNHACFCATTVNVVIFAGGKFRENVGKIFHVGVIFTILLLFPS